MADLNAGYPTPNLSRNIAIAHGVKLFFKDETATTPVYRDLGDLSDLAVNPVVEFVEHFSNHDGVNSLAKRIVQSRSLTIDATLNEINEDNLMLAMFGGTKNPSGSISYQFAEVVSVSSTTDEYTLTHTPALDADGNSTLKAATEKEATASTTDITNTGVTATASGTLAGETKLRFEYTVEMASATKSELFGQTNYHGEVQLHVLNNQGGVAQIFQLDDALISPSGSLNFPVDGVQSLPITIRSLVKNGKIGDMYLKDDA